MCHSTSSVLGLVIVAVTSRGCLRVPCLSIAACSCRTEATTWI
jgi:hypothetical protein